MIRLTSLPLLLLWPALAAADERPNVVIILADDLGWSELGCYGNSFNETPHLDRLAREGMRFTQAYAAAPVCSPYRASLLTGQYPARHGILDYLRPVTSQGLATNHVTLPEILKRHGYATGMVGKWHLTGYRFHGAQTEWRATDHGFDEEIAAEVKGVGNGANFWPYVFRQQPVRWINLPQQRLQDEEYLVDRMNVEAVDFIERHRHEAFFLYLSHYATHTILHGKPTLVEKYRRKHPPGASTRQRCYICQDAGHAGDPLNHWAGDHNPHLAAMLHSIDDGVGMILAKLQERQLSSKTLVIFTSDNGGETNVTSNAPLRGGKSQLYEGGIRVPLIARWPGRIPAATTCALPTINVDFYPTLLELAGIEGDPRQKLDGDSIGRLLRDPHALLERDAIFWHYPLERPHFLGGRSSSAVRSGDWKLIEFFDSGERELYDLRRDVGETQNLIAAHPNTARRLHAQLRQWRNTFANRDRSDR